MQCILTCYKMNWSQPFAQNDKEHYQKVFSCCMTVLDLVLLLTPGKHFGNLNFELLNHPIYSLDLAPLDFHLFGPLEGAIRGCQLADYSEMKEALCDCLHTQPKQFFWWHQEARGLLGKECWETGKLCRKVITPVIFHTKSNCGGKCRNFLITLIWCYIVIEQKN